MMKKILAGALAALMVAGSVVSASAVDYSHLEDSDITINVADRSLVNDVVSVDVDWGTTTFEYTFSGDEVWNPATHTYSNANENGWDETECEVTVTNHSNVAVDYKVELTDKDETRGVTTTETGKTGSLATAEGTAVADAPDGTYTLTIGGAPSAGTTFVLGNVDVSIKTTA